MKIEDLPQELPDITDEIVEVVVVINSVRNRADRGKIDHSSCVRVLLRQAEALDFTAARIRELIEPEVAPEDDIPF